MPDHLARLVLDAADSLPVLISYIDADQRYRLVNRAYTDWFGREREAFIGRTMKEVLGSEAFAALAPHVEAALSGQTVRFETLASYRDGGARYIDATYAPRWHPDGKVLGFYVLVQDISARREAEARLEQSEARLAAVLESVSDGFHALDANACFTLFNAASEAFFGVARNKVLGRPIWEVFPALVGSIFEGAIREALAGGRPPPVDGPSVARPERRVLVRASPKPGGGASIVFSDVTDRWLAEEALRASEAQAVEQLEELEAIYDTSPVGLAFLTPDLRFLRVNRRLADMNGAPAEAHIGRSVRDMAPDVADQVEAIKTRLDAGEEIVSFEISGETPAHPGIVGHWLEYWTPLRRPDGSVRGLAVVVEEITQRKRSEAQMRLLIDELNHRVKNTLAVVQNIARQTLKAEGVTDTARDALEQRLLALAAAHDVLTKTSWSTADLLDVVTGALGGETDDRIAARGPNIGVAPDVAVTLSLALHELATNARKYGALSQCGGRVDLGWTLEAGRVRLVWRETGGPPVSPPRRRGFGTRLLERAMDGVPEGAIRLDFAATGVICELSFLLAPA